MEKLKKELKTIIKAVKAYMKTEQLAGVEDFYLDPAFAHKGWVKPLPQLESLDELRREVSKCRQCTLYKTRRNPVFGEGNPKAKLVFVGEAPGREEDLQGKPFVGRAGELLTRIVEAMKLKRKDVFICNVLKCRPPENRNPLPSEIAVCQDYLWRQLEIIKPRVICCLGKFACSLFLGEGQSITKLRGNFSEFRGIKVMPTFHPAYLLRNPQAKGLVWKDMQKIMAELKKDVGGR